VGGVLESWPGGQAGNLDDARIAHDLLHPEGVAHGAGDGLELLLILARGCGQHHEEGDQQSHQVGEGHEPAVTAAVSPVLFPGHGTARSALP